MITYFHTFSYIYAVSNGYCSVVMDTALALVHGHKLEACPVEGADDGNDLDAVIPIDEVARRPDGTCRIRFKLGSAVFHSDLVTRVESVMSLSVPPSYRSKQSTTPDAPESIRLPRFPRPPLIGTALASVRAIGHSDDDDE